MAVTLDGVVAWWRGGEVVNNPESKGDRFLRVSPLLPWRTGIVGSKPPGNAPACAQLRPTLGPLFTRNEGARPGPPSNATGLTRSAPPRSVVAVTVSPPPPALGSVPCSPAAVPREFEIGAHRGAVLGRAAVRNYHFAGRSRLASDCPAVCGAPRQGSGPPGRAIDTLDHAGN